MDTVILERGYPAYMYKVEDEEKFLNELQLIPNFNSLLTVKYQTVSHFPSRVHYEQCLFTDTKDQTFSNYTVQDISATCTATIAVYHYCDWQVVSFNHPTLKPASNMPA